MLESASGKDRCHGLAGDIRQVIVASLVPEGDRWSEPASSRTEKNDVNTLCRGQTIVRNKGTLVTQRTIDRELEVLSQMFRLAKKDGYFPDPNPMGTG